MKKEKVLVMRFSALGDVAMTLPTLYDSCLGNPGTEFIMLTRKFPASLFMDRPENLTVIGIDTGDWKGVPGLVRLASRLWKEHGGFKTVVDLHDVLRTKVLRNCFRLRGATVSVIDKGRREKRDAIAGHRPESGFLTPTLERYRRTFDKSGIECRPLFKGLFMDGSPHSQLYSGLVPPRAENERWFGIAPFAAHPGKVYPTDMTLEVVRILSEQPMTKIFLFGNGPKEEGVFDRWTAEIPSLVKVCGAGLGLQGEMALMADCEAILSMDSANMHLASLVGTRVVSIWGATHPCLGFLGWDQNPEDALGTDMDCRPCSVYGAKPCAKGDYPCLRGIPPRLVAQKLLGYSPAERITVKE